PRSPCRTNFATLQAASARRPRQVLTEVVLVKIQKIQKRFVPALLFSAATSLATAQATPTVFVAPSMNRIGMTEAPRRDTKVTLAAARGEYESFQIVAHGGSNGLTNVNLTVSPLKSATGKVIPQTAFTLFREKYVQVTSSSPNWKGSNQPLPPGWYADGL